MRSYASRNQLAAYPGLRQAGQELEWERRCAKSGFPLSPQLLRARICSVSLQVLHVGNSRSGSAVEPDQAFCIAVCA